MSTDFEQTATNPATAGRVSDADLVAAQMKAMNFAMDAIFGPAVTPSRVPPRTVRELPKFTCCYSDDFNNDWDVTYTADGEYEDAGPVGESGYSYGSTPQITVTAVEISGHAVPVKAFARAFIDALEEYCAEDHVEQAQSKRDYEESEYADMKRRERDER